MNSIKFIQNDGIRIATTIRIPNENNNNNIFIIFSYTIYMFGLQVTLRLYQNATDRTHCMPPTPNNEQPVQEKRA